MAPSPAPELPDWAIQLLLAVQQHEDEHAATAPCLGNALNAVPADVTRYAALIDAHTRPLLARIAELEEQQKGADITARAGDSLRTLADTAIDKERQKASELAATLIRVKELANSWEFTSGRRDARRELLAALATPKEQQ